jgi:hypothetical protein
MNYDTYIIAYKSCLDPYGNEVPIEEQKVLCLKLAQKIGCHLERIKVLISENLLDVLIKLKQDIEEKRCQRIIIYNLFTHEGETLDELLELLKKKKIRLYLAYLLKIEEQLVSEKKEIMIDPEVHFSKMIIRGFPPDWCFSKRGREKEIAVALAKWAKKHFTNSQCFISVRGIIYKNKDIEWFYPDIDVLVVSNKEVIAFEVKLLKGKKTDLPTVIERGKVIEVLKTLRSVDEAIYTALGEALFNCLKSNKSYLVIPAPAVTNELIELINVLPIGLIAFEAVEERGYKFIIKKSAPFQKIGRLKDKILELNNLNQLIFSKKL